MDGITSIVTFVCGAALLIFSAEKLVDCLARAASCLRISMFALAIIFTGIEFDDLVLGLTFNAQQFHGVALGIVLGTAISVSAVVLALGALLAPSVIKVRREYVLMFVAAPLVLLAFSVTGSFTVVDGGILIALFVAFLAYVLVREVGPRAPVRRDAAVFEPALAHGSAGEQVRPVADQYVREATRVQAVPAGGGAPDRSVPAKRTLSGWITAGLAVLCLAGIILGASITSNGAENMLATYHLDGTVFGATIATLVLTIGDIFITVEPLRKGVPDIGIANVIGSLVFSVTGKLGVTLLVGGITVSSQALHWHLPVLIVITALAGAVLWTGRLKRWHGALLLACYAAYWVTSFVVFGSVPVDTG